MSDDPLSPADVEPAARFRFRPFAARRARKAAAKAATVEQRAWWHMRWSDAMTASRQRVADAVPVRRRRLEADLERDGVGYLRLPGSNLHVRVGHMEPEGPVVNDSAFVHEHTGPVMSPSGRWGKGEPYRNPARAAKLAKSGRLRKDLPS